ncbi:N4-gp56 family major capsid protein [Comamonas serinivorans]|uniref:N4-gp56 family major capsid protein n=1 Tax=Comamonas serinivorans TaxID=1082851 RepID=A0A1Y0ERB0_9BURK|nr:N4-gp56 family major capsid protein [Comamonas serinivorans]ARU06143.1 N4-gp56 family major capsid protein [Comamonas serinivorans]
MSQTFVGVNDPQAVKKWSTLMNVAINKSSYWSKRFVGEGKTARLPIQRIDDLTSGAGDEVTVDLLMPLAMEPRVGDQELSGQEANLRYYTDRLRIDQIRGGVNQGSRMTKKRTLRNLREDARQASADWWMRLWDELYFIYLSGSLGDGGGMLWRANNPMFDVNPLSAPDAEHHLLPQGVASAAALTATDTMTLRMIDRAAVKAETMGGDGSDELSMIPVRVEGGEHYIHLMHPWQADALRQNANPGGWLDIQKAAAAAEGRASPIFHGTLGMHNNVVLHKHRNVIRFSDGGVGGDVPYARSLFLGAQAAMVAFGDNESGTRYKWTEEKRDHDNYVSIGTHSVAGVKKSTYKSKDGKVTRDFGVFAVDTAVVNPV